MKGPFDEPVVAEEGTAIEGAARPRGRKPTDKPPGGKALERLMLFNESHGFVIETGGETRSGKPRRRRAAAGATLTASPNASLAQSFVEAGEVLARATTSTLNDLERSAAPGETAPGQVAALGALASIGGALGEVRWAFRWGSDDDRRHQDRADDGCG